MTNATKNTVGTIFTERYEEVTTEIDFDPKWANGTGYYDYAVEAVELKPGEMAKSFDAGTGRRIILIGTRFGSVVVFDRYTNQGEGGVYVTNEPANFVIKQFVPSGSIGEHSMYVLLGSWGIETNLGYTIEKMAKELAA